jgi:hypothetical protein
MRREELPDVRDLLIARSAIVEAADTLRVAIAGGYEKKPLSRFIPITLTVQLESYSVSATAQDTMQYIVTPISSTRTKDYNIVFQFLGTSAYTCCNPPSVVLRKSDAFVFGSHSLAAPTSAAASVETVALIAWIEEGGELGDAAIDDFKVNVNC